MYVAYGALALHLPHARDLKSKRRVLRALIDRLHARLRVSVAETGCHDLLQRAEIGIALVAVDLAELDELLDRIRGIVDNQGEIEVLGWDPVVVEEER